MPITPGIPGAVTGPEVPVLTFMLSYQAFTILP